MSHEVEIGRGKRGRRAYTLDDIALVPARRTRDPEDVNVGWQIDAYHVDIPLMAAPMDSVMSPETAIAFGRLGGIGVLDLDGLWTRYEDPTPILDQIAQLHKVRGITIVLVSHSMEDVAKYAQRLIVVNHGEIAFDDTPKKVFAHFREMEPMGLAAPQITYIMHALKEKGLDVDPSDTTVEEAKQDILEALKKINSPLLKGGVKND